MPENMTIFDRLHSGGNIDALNWFCLVAANMLPSLTLPDSIERIKTIALD
jgi:hypothetical protein